jgi:pimeloyl-ACP methyl ester carboxylesterase
MWSKYIDVGDQHGLALAVTEWSRRGMPCVLLHGLGDAACVWNHLAYSIIPNFRIVALDLRGHGNSDWDPEARYDSETFAADLTTLATVFGFERMILVGHSVGAAAAIRFAANNAGRVAGLVIVDFGPELDQAGVDGIVRTFVTMPRCFASPEDYTQWLIARRPLGDPNLLRQFARGSLRPSPLCGWELKVDAALATSSEISSLSPSNGRYCLPGLWPALKRIKCPSLVIRGNGSSVFPYDVAVRMVDQALPAGRFASIESAGHAVMMDNPGAFAGSVRGFLDGLST